MEYALNLNPTVSNSGNIPKAIVNGDSIDFTYYSIAHGIVYTPEVSRTLASWTNQGVSISGPTSTGFSTASVPETGFPCFFRLVVSE